MCHFNTQQIRYYLNTPVPNNISIETNWHQSKTEGKGNFITCDITAAVVSMKTDTCCVLFVCLLIAYNAEARRGRARTRTKSKVRKNNFAFHLLILISAVSNWSANHWKIQRSRV